ncbi:GlxA family transcriptional regulator [Celeribacter neptunius]|uniref:Transcriptional regulator GlxA family, contains an amidase domain and an AraC-type DNA-binding HTH domain n=1 Tax=Celeribacter neptunius TaxID=588602 RepID=A0A1I3L2Y3_9RHOB|nr:GlxA family transcriptional regulator [Celeribacter neptunius]SFI79061.1 Transcriptional regulator GlxA family, contains an amidase domain and an AraC-type DNA-binding HTH domain [Celeribacter neptunius]
MSDTARSHPQRTRDDQAPILFEFVLLDAFSMLSVISAIEPLRVANRILGYGYYAWKITSESGAPVRASNGIVVESEGRVGEGRLPDYTFACAGLSLIAENQSRLNAFLSRRQAAGVTLGAISMGTIFLARAGLLKDVRCTIHWEGQPAFVEEFPDIDLSTAIFEIDRGIMTCAGGLSSFDMFLEIIGRDHSERMVRAIANQLQTDRVRTSISPQNTGASRVLDTAPKQVRKAIELINSGLEHPLSPNELASAVGTSRRTLERLFLKYTGLTPSKYSKAQRLERARDLLLHSSMTILDVAIATGFRSGSYFSSCFSEFFGTSPSQLRQFTLETPAPKDR